MSAAVKRVSTPVQIEHVTLTGSALFERVVAALRARVPALDGSYQAALASGDVGAARAALERLAPLSIFGARDHGQLLRIAGVARREAQERIDALLALVGIPEAARLLPHELSGGMRMRVSIARALVTRPRLLLMDEPFAALDEITRFRLNDDLVRIAAEVGCTVVFVTHSVYESVYLSDRIAMMTARPGRIAREMAITLPAPRRAELRRDPAYLAACAAVSGAFEEIAGG